MEKFKTITISILMLLMAIMNHTSNVVFLIGVLGSLLYVVGIISFFPIIVFQVLVWMFLAFLVMKLTIKYIA